MLEGSAMKAMLFLVAMAFVVNEWKPEHPVKVAPDGITELEAEFCPGVSGPRACPAQNRADVTAKIRTLRLEEGAENGGERNRGFHCSGGWTRCSPVLEIELEVDGKNVYVPASVYADLADVSTAELRQAGETITLELECGDASGSYSVRIVFDANDVIKRQIISAFGTNEVAEETTYFELTPLN